MVLITIDGNIGAGKSTILKFLKDVANINADLEPVDEWEPFLVDMYKNNKDGFEFQVKVWTDRCFNQNYDSDSITCIERSPLFQWNVFTKANYYNGKLSDRQYNLLNNLYDFPSYKPDLYIYLRTDPLKCIERIKVRDRNSESDIDTAYITQIHDLHEKTYNEIKEYKHCVEIEGKNIEHICNEVLQIIKKFNSQ